MTEMTDRDTDIDMLDAQTFSALPAQRQVEIAAELLKRGDMQAIENLGIKIVTPEELANEPSDVIEIKSLN
jgi:hypothetical protein